MTIHVARNRLNTGFHYIQVTADQGFPITNTGYRSHFMPPSELDQWDTVKAFVRDWLDDTAETKQWQDHLLAQRQPQLF